MMLTLFMNTAGGKNITPFIDLNTGHTKYFTYKGDFQSITMAFQSVNWAYACIRIDIKPPNTEKNTGALKPARNAAASVNIPVHRLTTAEPYTFLRLIIQGCLTYRQETTTNRKRNTTEGLLWNAPTSARKRTIN